MYVNRRELLNADLLSNTPTTAVAAFYGEQTVVRITQSHGNLYAVKVVTLLPRALVQVLGLVNDRRANGRR